MPLMTYPLDLTGTSTANKIINEAHTLSVSSWSDYHMIIPLAAPFYTEGLVIKKMPTNQTLVKGVDWIPTHKFLSASISSGKEVYGSITFLNKLFNGALKVTYQTLGGEFTLNSNQQLEILTNLSNNPRITSWETVANTPGLGYPALGHSFNVDDLRGVGEVITAIDGITNAVSQRTATNFFKIPNNTQDASLETEGTIRYRRHLNKSFVEVCMRNGSGATSFEWAVIKENSWT